MLFLFMDEQTIKTYNDNAAKYASDYEQFAEGNQKFIDQVLEFVPNKNNPLVVELGCGNGRDAQHLKKYTKNYIGIDASEGLIKLAQKRNPELHFIINDMTKADLPDNIDLVLAIASFLHLSKAELEEMIANIIQKLKPGGILGVLSIKGQGSFVREDDKGKRLYFRYTTKELVTMAKDQLEILEEAESSIPQLEDTWFRAILRKK